MDYEKPSFRLVGKDVMCHTVQCNQGLLNLWVSNKELLGRV